MFQTARRLALVTLTSAMLAAALPVASASADAVVNGVAYRAMPTTTAEIVVTALDDSETLARIGRMFEDALKSGGYRVAQAGTLVLTFEMRHETGSWSKGDRRSILEVEGTASSKHDEDAKVRLNIFDSGRGGMLNEGEGDPVRATQRAQIRIDVTIDDRDAKKRLWQGWAIAEMNQRNEIEVSQDLVPILVSKIGQTVRREVLSLP